MKNITKELLRKLIHLIQLPIIAGYTFLHVTYSPRVGILAITALLLLLLEFEYIRINYQMGVGNWLRNLFNKMFLRRHEKNNITGAVYFIISTIIVFSAFDYKIALVSLLMTVFGDLSAAIVGTAFGKRKIFGNKSYVGACAGLVVNIIIGSIILAGYPSLFLPMALTASLVETLTRKLDDNLTVPLFAGFAGQTIVFLGHIGLSQL